MFDLICNYLFNLYFSIMSSFDDTNEMKDFTKKAMSIPLLAEEHEKVLAKKF